MISLTNALTSSAVTRFLWPEPRTRPSSTPSSRASLRTDGLACASPKLVVAGATATVLWEMMRHMLAWYYTTMSQIQVVYGSLTTAVVALLSVEIGALVLLVGAQVIAEYERIGREPVETAGRSMKLD